MEKHQIRIKLRKTSGTRSAALHMLVLNVLVNVWSNTLLTYSPSNLLLLTSGLRNKLGMLSRTLKPILYSMTHHISYGIGLYTMRHKKSLPRITSITYVLFVSETSFAHQTTPHDMAKLDTSHVLHRSRLSSEEVL